MHIIVPVLPDLLQRYPQLRIELDVNNHPVSLVGERIDVAIRITDNPEPGMIARRLGECRSVLCASPHYLASRGVPVQLEDLSRHNCLHYSFLPVSRGVFDARRGVGHDGGQRQSQRQYLVIADGGGDKPLWYCHAARARGRRGATAGQPRVPVLGAFTPKPIGIFGIYQSRDYQPAAQRVFWMHLQTTLPRARTSLSSCKMDYASYTYPFVSQKESKNDDS